MLGAKRDYIESSELEDNSNSDIESENPRKIAKKKLKKTPDSHYEDTEFDACFDVSKTFEAGIILKVSVSEFMCHERFDIEFGKNVNFVTGLNGSGKKSQ